MPHGVISVASNETITADAHTIRGAPRGGALTHRQHARIIAIEYRPAVGRQRAKQRAMLARGAFERAEGIQVRCSDVGHYGDTWRKERGQALDFAKAIRAELQHREAILIA